MSEDTLSASNAPTLSSHARNKLALERAGAEEILDRIRAGETQTDIAAALGVSRQALTRYMSEHVDSVEFARARAESAEYWADRGWQCLQEAKGTDAAAVNLARYMEQHCMRRAGIVNARYSEKQSVELSGPNGGPIQAQSVVTVYVPQNNRDAGQTIDLAGQDYVENASD